MEKMLKRSIADILQEKKKPDLKSRLKLTRGVLESLSWLHSLHPPIQLCDVSPSAFLVDENDHVKVHKIGLASVEDKNPMYLAPEILVGQEFNHKADIYQLGFFFYEFIFLEQAKIDGIRPTSVEDCKLLIVNQKKRPPFPENTPSSLAALITAFWSPDPTQRPDVSTLLPKFQSIMIDCLISDSTGRHLWKRFYSGKVVYSLLFSSPLLFSFLHSLILLYS